MLPANALNDPSDANMPEATHPSSQPEPPHDEALRFPGIPGYRFQKRLGRGGMATVYLATQESLDRPVSIKVLEREALQDETGKQRFENEARTIAKLSHSAIVGIHEVGRTADGQMYYVMPYLPNGDLSQRDLRNDEVRIAEILRALLSALEYAHAHGVVHRDVKEENVLFDSHDRPQLTDFGIALSKRDTSRLTSDGLSVGSSGFMAPEQARGEVVDGRADLYSVGVLTFALLTGHLPFRATDPLSLALMHAQDPVPRLPPEKRHWQGFVDRAMAKSPAQRFNGARQMLQTLDKISRAGDNTFSARVLAGLDSLEEKVGGRPRLAMLAAAMVLLAAIGWYVWPTRLAEPALPALPATAPPHAAVIASQASPTIAPASPATTASGDTPAEPNRPATEPAQTAPSKPKTAQRTPAKTPVTTHRPKKKKSWLSRLFRRR